MTDLTQGIRRLLEASGQIYRAENPSKITAALLILLLAISVAGCGLSASSGKQLPSLTSLKIATSTLPSAQVQGSYQTSLTASGGKTPYTWQIASGALPNGLSLTQATGTIAGTPSQSGNFTFTAKVQDSSAPLQTASQSFTLNVSSGTSPSGLQITTTSLPSAQMSQPYQVTVGATGGTTPYTWGLTSNSGPLAPGLSLSATTGQISGTPSQTGQFSFTLQVTDSSAPPKTAAQTFSLPVLGTGLDQYGGRTDKKCASATGWFHTEKLGNQWWLCTPVGDAFFMEGVYVVDPFDSNYVAAIIKKYGDNGPAWAEQTDARLKAWGFNTLGLYASTHTLPISLDPSYPIDSNGLHSHPTKLPFVINVRPASYSMTNPPISTVNFTQQKLLTDPVKNMMYGVSPYYKEYNPPGGVGDYYDPKMATWLAADLSQEMLWSQIKNSPYGNYLIGISTDDGDEMYGFGATDAFATTPSGHNNSHLGWIVATMAPVQEYNAHLGTLYQDTAIHSKTAWRNALAAKYVTISALNAAWGSNYTTFDSSGVQVPGESIGTGNGSTTIFTGHLAHTPVAPLSVLVSVGGTAQGGDCPYWIADCGMTVDGALKGPSGSLIQTGVQAWLSTVASQACSCSLPAASYWVKIMYHFPSTSGALASPSREVGQTVSAGQQIVVSAPQPDPQRLATGYDVYVATTPLGGNGQNLETLQATNVPFSTNWTEPITGIQAGAALPAIPSTISYSTGALQITFSTPPPVGSAITVSYTYNGWMSGGTGLLDEDARPAHRAWMGIDYIGLTDTNANTKTDLDSFLQAIAGQYLGMCKTQLKATFPNVLYLGPDSLGSWAAPARAPVLKAAGQYLDMMITGGVTGFTQPMIDYVAQYYGDKPYYEGEYRTANADSAFSAFPDNFVGGFATQGARGQDYYNEVTSLQSKSSTINGSHPYVGEHWWQYTDNSSEDLNWGLVTLKDNAYDGHESVQGIVQCSAPQQQYTCGGEAGNYGDVISFVRSANLFWLTH